MWYNLIPDEERENTEFIYNLSYGKDSMADPYRPDIPAEDAGRAAQVRSLRGGAIIDEILGGI